MQTLFEGYNLLCWFGLFSGIITVLILSFLDWIRSYYNGRK